MRNNLVQPDPVTIEYDTRNGREQRTLPVWKSRAFYMKKLKANKNPTILKGPKP